MSIFGSMEGQKSLKDHDKSHRHEISNLKGVSEGLGDQNDLKSQYGGLKSILGSMEDQKSLNDYDESQISSLKGVSERLGNKKYQKNQHRD